MPAEYHGHYEKRSEVDAFVPCEISERWWVEDPQQLLLPHVTWSDGHVGGEIYVEVQGVVSEPGRYGHLGAYDRILTVREVMRTDALRKTCSQ